MNFLPILPLFPHNYNFNVLYTTSLINFVEDINLINFVCNYIILIGI